MRDVLKLLLLCEQHLQPYLTLLLVLRVTLFVYVFPILYIYLYTSPLYISTRILHYVFGGIFCVLLSYYLGHSITEIIFSYYSY